MNRRPPSPFFWYGWLEGATVELRLIFRESCSLAIDRVACRLYHPSLMTAPDLDALQRNYKDKIEKLIAAIRAEEAFATADHSETAMEKWDNAHFALMDAVGEIRTAREAYKEGLRQLHYGI
jgi:hypothetical protein